jgi:hypothetical protein
MPAQFTHCVPAMPHAVFWLPIAQTSAPMQQPAQLAGLQFGCGTHWPLLHVSFALQTKHPSPALPHAPGVVATTQSLPAQQPGQLSGPHVTGVWHVPSFGWPGATHVWPVAVQSPHAWPPIPHAVESTPATQVVPLQHPVQLSGPHLGVPTHAPPERPGVLEHVSPMSSQLWHAWPALPHARSLAPSRHLSPTQHPAQFVASHFPAPHAREDTSHARPSAAQSSQMSPDCPQAVASVPARHFGVALSKLQQPLGHSLASQLTTLRPQTLRPSQNWKPFAMQSEQRCPADPHARVSLPTRHLPVPSQQPFGQFDGPHVVGGGVTPPSGRPSTSRLARPHPGAATTSVSAEKRATTKT